MIKEPWLPIGHMLPDGLKAQKVLFEGLNWQIITTYADNRALLVNNTLHNKWLTSNLLELGAFTRLCFGNIDYWYLSSSITQQLSPIINCDSPNSKSDAIAFSQALKVTRDIDEISSFQNAIYIEKLSRLLPTYNSSSNIGDDTILGCWLTGGANVSVNSFQQLQKMTGWLTTSDLKDIVETAGFVVDESVSNEKPDPSKKFILSGRPELEAFINEHIIDVIQNKDRYKALGIDFPSAIALHGPPGCGKTFAVRELVDFLGWPSFEIDASSIASPYIHETSKKVSEVFDKAIKNSPSILIIDEMEAFLADREIGLSHNRVEEVAEFLRRIPEAVKNNVLIIAMTNRIEIIDPAILRRGRFDHIIKVDFADELDIKSLLEEQLGKLPQADDIDTAPLARELSGRPLSDVSFVVREGARLAAKNGKDKIDQECLQAALDSAPARDREGRSSRRIGFM